MRRERMGAGQRRPGTAVAQKCTPSRVTQIMHVALHVQKNHFARFHSILFPDSTMRLDWEDTFTSLVHPVGAAAWRP
jgi:hypothetical protein